MPDNDDIGRILFCTPAPRRQNRYAATRRTPHCHTLHLELASLHPTPSPLPPQSDILEKRELLVESSPLPTSMLLPSDAPPPSLLHRPLKYMNTDTPVTTAVSSIATTTIPTTAPIDTPFSSSTAGAGAGDDVTPGGGGTTDVTHGPVGIAVGPPCPPVDDATTGHTSHAGHSGGGGGGPTAT